MSGQEWNLNEPLAGIPLLSTFNNIQVAGGGRKRVEDKHFNPLRNKKLISLLTLNLLTTTIVAPPSNTSKWQMGFNSAFKGLILLQRANSDKILQNTYTTTTTTNNNNNNNKGKGNGKVHPRTGHEGPGGE